MATAGTSRRFSPFDGIARCTIKRLYTVMDRKHSHEVEHFCVSNYNHGNGANL
jgi:hypothetical protein